MKIKTIAVLAAVSLLPLSGFSQTPTPVPPIPPVPAVPPVPPVPAVPSRDKGPKVPVTYLGVETSEVPRVVSEQLGLAKGFGLVVDYVVPDGPAAVAGLQQSDIIKMLNDQILTEPDQLAKLVRSFAEGTSVTLTVLRKGAETKVTVKLGKREVSQRSFMHGFGKKWGNMHDFGEEMGKFGEEMGKLGVDIGNLNLGHVGGREAADQMREQAREQARLAREEGRRARELARDESRRARDEARRAADEVRRAAREMRISRRDDGGVKSTTIDMARAQIIFHDAQGELKIENLEGKKMLTAKDSQGRLVFSGPISTKEELDKVPADVRQRYEKLEQKDLPAINPAKLEADRDTAADSGENEDDEEDDDSESAEIQEVKRAAPRAFPYRHLGFNTVLI